MLNTTLSLEAGFFVGEVRIETDDNGFLQVYIKANNGKNVFLTKNERTKLKKKNAYTANLNKDLDMNLEKSLERNGFGKIVDDETFEFDKNRLKKFDSEGFDEYESYVEALKEISEYEKRYIE